MRRHWFMHAYGIELRKLLAYRVDFWLNLIGTLLVHVGVAFFLWDAVFTASASGRDGMIGGFRFQEMILYTVLAHLVNQILHGQDFGYMSADIYDGSLNRYLVFPVSFFGYKFAAHLATASIALLQFTLTLGLFAMVFGLPESSAHGGPSITLPHLMTGICFAILAGYLYFTMASCLELVAFWADNVWSLLVMLRFSAQLLGGGLVPLALFPEWAQPALQALPFSTLLDLPIRIILGRFEFAELSSGLFRLAAWSLCFTVLYAWIWRRGTRQYTGIGI